jgi:hypothetical protein
MTGIVAFRSAKESGSPAFAACGEPVELSESRLIGARTGAGG